MIYYNHKARAKEINMTFSELVDKAYRDIVDLMFWYETKWIYHLDELRLSVDVENAAREKYNLWNSSVDINEHLAKFDLI